MGRRTKVWEVRDDYRPILKKIKKLYPTLLGHVHTRRIFLCGFQNKSSGFIAKIGPNRYPWALINNDYDYCIQFWCTRFDAEEEAYKHFVVLHELFHIPAGGFEDGNRKEYRKLLHHDVEDFRSLLKNYGIYLENVKDVMKGEEHLLNKEDDGPRRFPRVAHIK